MRKFRTSTQLWQILIKPKMWPTKRKKIGSCSYWGQILFPLPSCRNASLRFSCKHQPLWGHEGRRRLLSLITWGKYELLFFIFPVLSSRIYYSNLSLPASRKMGQHWFINSCVRVQWFGTLKCCYIWLLIHAICNLCVSFFHSVGVWVGQAVVAKFQTWLMGQECWRKCIYDIMFGFYMLLSYYTHSSFGLFSKGALSIFIMIRIKWQYLFV